MTQPSSRDQRAGTDRRPGLVGRLIPITSWLPAYKPPRLHSKQIHLGFAHTHSPVVDMLQRSGFIEALGGPRIFPNLTSALTWAETRPQA